MKLDNTIIELDEDKIWLENIRIKLNPYEYPNISENHIILGGDLYDHIKS